TYDRYQNVATLEDALSQTESYSYTPNGTLITKTDRNGTDFTYGIDGLGRTLTIHASKSGTMQNNTTAYTYGGQVSSTSADGVTTSYTYDGYGRVILELNLVTLGASGIPSQKAYTYDLSGRMLTSAITVNGVTNTTSYTYDRLGRVVTVKDNGDTEATYTYDANGNRATMTLGNGEVTTYTYNLANLVKTLVNKDESNNTLSSCSYLYRLDGNQVGKQEGSKTTLYAYDDLGRLTAEAVTENQTTVTTGYTFDAYNNRATKTIGASNVAVYTYDANDRMLTETTGEGTTNYTYDNNGSQLTTTIGASTTTNTYDLFGQLKSYIDINSVVINYAYGPDGLRTCKTSGNSTTTYVWDGGNITNEFVSVTVNGNTTTTENRYVYGIGRVKAFLGMTEVYYLYNARGDVINLIDTACDIIKSYVYDAFGIETNPSVTDANPFRYCGEYFDKETETYYLRARYYKPNTGRFLSEDPIRYGLNIYTYCNNNPILYIDPIGLYEVPFTQEELDFNYIMDMLFINGAGGSADPSIYNAYLYFMNSDNQGKPISMDVLQTALDFIMGLDFFTATRSHDIVTGSEDTGNYISRSVNIAFTNMKYILGTSYAYLESILGRDMNTGFVVGEQCTRYAKLRSDQYWGVNYYYGQDNGKAGVQGLHDSPDPLNYFYPDINGGGLEYVLPGSIIFMYKTKVGHVLFLEGIASYEGKTYIYYSDGNFGDRQPEIILKYEINEFYNRYGQFRGAIRVSPR
ncbi:MAG TPA: RHS repeat-associated core domain-containing protein, partial [Oscillospiraceae bacterium]|nr:RHS repeat-associated core domain-containing protein [Oscillospiraceae bacterium]